MFRIDGNRARVGLACMAASLALAGCAKGTPQLQSGPVTQGYPGGVDAADFTYVAPDSPQYMVQAGDVLSVNVRGEPQLSLDQVRVNSDGSFMAPGAGSIRAEGQTPVQIATSIENVLRRTYLRDPNVAVNVAEIPPQMVTVEGALASPGMYPFSSRTTLLGAVAMAKGPTERARPDQVVIFREIDGVPMAARFDLNLIRSGQMADPVILPGDRVVVADRGSTILDDVLEAVPLLFFFTRI